MTSACWTSPEASRYARTRSSAREAGFGDEQASRMSRSACCIASEGDVSRMATIVLDCPRCGSKRQTMSVVGAVPIPEQFATALLHFNVASFCRNCLKPVGCRATTRPNAITSVRDWTKAWCGEGDLTKYLSFGDISPPPNAQKSRSFCQRLWSELFWKERALASMTT